MGRDPSAVLAELDDDLREALASLAENDPALLRETLVDLGYLDADDGQEIVENREAVELTPAQSRLSELLSSMGNPRSTTDIIDLLGEQHAEFFDTYKSARHRSWMSNQLNALVNAGELGRYRDGRSVLYTPDITGAVRYWGLKNDYFVEDLTTRHVGRIASDTGMPRWVVQRAIARLSED
ncbi:hypothetical protein NGM10_05685 [Halorussus salilacus]|uniref:hypothetical protein n=1 Tax=Halorussus salilacus TaxID=2953750 RepID=UPI0020A22088|nr:hypothetical protein [Halorussus salilacus]USZ69231.1 hypothetical protein NGM10_05685 [Halorussus salilacus]